jgi:hypothetical protein
MRWSDIRRWGSVVRRPLEPERLGPMLRRSIPTAVAGPLASRRDSPLHRRFWCKRNWESNRRAEKARRGGRRARERRLEADSNLVFRGKPMKNGTSRA